MTVTLLYAPVGADPDDVFARCVAEEWTIHRDGTMTIEVIDEPRDPFRPPDPKRWKAEVGATLEAFPANATRLEGDDTDDIHLRDEGNGFGYLVYDSGVEIYIRHTDALDRFAQLWKVLRAVARAHSCLAFYFDESIQLDLTLRARDAYRRYPLI